jgi:hypothetical protein
MKVALTMLVLLSGLAGSITDAQASPFGGGWGTGGWDGNNVRLSVSQSKLLPAQTKAPADCASAKPGGGWDLNDVRVSVTSGSKLLSK